MKYVRDTVLHVLGWILVLAGIVGIFVPFLQGLILIFVGLYLLSVSSDKFRAFLDRIPYSHHVTGRFHAIDAKLRRIFSRSL